MTDHTRVLDLHNWSSNKLRQAILAFVKEAQSPRTHGVIRDILDSGNFEQANRLIENAVTRLGNTLPQLFVDLAGEEINHLGSKLGHRVHITSILKADSNVTVSFNPTNERAASLMRTSRLDFIQNFTEEQSVVTRQILANAFSQGQGTRQTAKELVDSIGLTRTQLAAVDNYRTLLENGSTAALTRQLRDRRFDSTVQNAIDGNVLTSEQINRMVDRYREQMLNYRAENIARTESLTVLSTARHEAMTQVIEQSGIDPSQVERTWHRTNDNRTRHSHREMEGQVRGMDEPFTSGLGNELMYPGDPDAPAEDRINCRCSVSYRINQVDEMLAA